MDNKRTWNDYSRCEICLINPPWQTKDNDIWHGIKATMPPLGLLSIAAFLEDKGRAVAMIDLEAEKLSTQQLKTRLTLLQPKIVGITVMTVTAAAANLIARLTKEVNHSTIVVMGGVHAELIPEECLSNKDVDIIVRGDGEITFYHLSSAILDKTPYSHIAGISFRDSKNGKAQIIHNPPRDEIGELDRLPFSAYHLVPMHRYYPALGAYRHLPAINMLMTRGCPGKCNFCNSAKTALRIRNAEFMVEEILQLKNQYGIKEIQFYDDNFTIVRKNVLLFCELMDKSKVDISWSVFARADLIDSQLLQAMKKAGCHQICFGVESGDFEILSKIGKPISFIQTEKAVKMAQNAGIEVRCSFVYGCAGETISSLQKTLDFAIKLDPDLAIFNIATPYPGTELFQWAKQNGYLRHEQWSQYALGSPLMTLPTLSLEELTKFYKKSYRAFYCSPKIIWRKVKKAVSLCHWRDMITAFIFIMSGIKLGARGNVKKDWLTYDKDAFFDYQFYKEADLTNRLTHELRKTGFV